ncbi:hypothetical protein AD998_05905 [bacterium 336/3]|nr:hypothetical protein AD998_05905 [bacterium 336/3]
MQHLLEIDYLEKLKDYYVGDKAIIHKYARIYNMSNQKEYISIGNETVIDGELLVFKYGGQISIGNNCYVGMGTRIWSGEKVQIGNDVLISHNVNIIDTNSHELDYIERAESYHQLVRNDHKQYKGNIVTKEIIIEDNVWISFNVTILKGVRIGQGAIIAANTVITKNVPSFVMMGGNPAYIIKKLD